MIPFVKAHGLGNDFVLVDRNDLSDLDLREFAQSICDREFGVGADGVLLRDKDDETWRMGLVNADGTTANMCGNGLRCFAAWLRRDGHVDQSPFLVRTGTRDVLVQAHSAEQVTVDMGEPELLGSLTVQAVGEKLDGWAASFGDPHFVTLVDELETLDVEEAGSSIQANPEFPDGTNVMFVEARSKKQFDIRSWERGVGETLACGSGACAAMAVLADSGKSDSTATFGFALGELKISVESGRVSMTGPAFLAFDGRWPG